MNTSNVALRTVEQFMADYTPIYQPVYPLLMGKSQSYSEQVGQLDFRRVQTVGDIRAKHVTPKDTTIRKIAVSESKKSFYKYFLANQYTISTLQDQQGTEEVVSMVLDEHQKQMDELVLFGEGTANNNVVNNGLFYSADPNFTEESSVSVASTDRLYDLHNKVVANANKAEQLSGRKVIIFYGTNILPLYDSLYPEAVVAFKKALLDVLGADYSTFRMPPEITPSAHGWMIVNLDQVKTHYTAVPSLKEQGTNSEMGYNWFNFLMGSTMVEVLAKNAIIKQPATLA